MPQMSKSEYRLMKAAEDSNWWYSSKRNLVLGLARKFARKGASVLDVGCGTGRNLRELSENGFSVKGIDNSWHAIKHSRELLGGKIFFWDISKKSFGKFDCIVCLDVLEHIKDHETAAENIYSSLKKGGCAIISVPCHQFLFSGHDKSLGHIRRYSAKELKSVLEKSGFKIEQMTYWNSALFPFIAAMRLLKNIAPGKSGTSHMTELRELPKPINLLFKALMLIENRLIFSGISMPFGLSIVCVAKK